MERLSNPLQAKKGEIKMIAFDSGQLRIARRNVKPRLKLKDVADIMGFKTAASVANRENGLTSTTADELAKFANLYNVDVQTFFIPDV